MEINDTFPISRKKAKDSFADRIRFEDHINDTYIHTPSAVNNIVTNVPIGSICWFNRTTAPDGWVICDGNYYDANGEVVTASTTGAIETPNLIGKYPLGATTDIGTSVEAGLPALPNHTHLVPNLQDKISGTGGYGVTGQDNADTVVWLDNIKTGDATYASSTIYGNSTTVTPPSVNLLPCMKIYNADTDDFETYVKHAINVHVNDTDVLHVTSTEKDTWNNKVSNETFNSHVNDTNLHYSGLPIGTVIWWPGEAAERPSGFLLLDGSTYDTDEYPELYAILKKNELPNYIGRFVKGSIDAGDTEDAGIPEIYGQFSGVGESNASSTDIHPYGEGAIRPAFAGYTTDNAVESKLGVLVANTGGAADDVYAFRASLGQLKSKYLNYTDKELAGKHSIAFVGRSDSVYGKSDTVTPANISAVPLIKAKHYATVYAPGSLDETLRVEHNELRDTVKTIKQTAITTTKSSYTIDVYSGNTLVGSTTCYCRTHSDGYKEMWGVITITTVTKITKFMLPESFSDANYNVLVSQDFTNSELQCVVELDTITLTHPTGMSVGYHVRWKASGY